MTLCPPELNDVSLAESVVILMRYAVIKELSLNTEVQKPSVEEVLEFQGPRMDCTPHSEARAYSSAYEGGEVMQKFEVENTKDAMDQSTAEKHRGILLPVSQKESTVVRRIHGLESQKQKHETWRVCRRGSPHTRDKAQQLRGPVWRVLISNFF